MACFCNLALQPLYPLDTDLLKKKYGSPGNKAANKAKDSKTIMTHADSFAQNKGKMLCQMLTSRFMPFYLQHFIKK